MDVDEESALHPYTDTNNNKNKSRKRAPPPPDPVTDLGHVIKSPLDSKQYKAIQLGNGLKALLVSTCYPEMGEGPEDDDDDGTDDLTSLIESVNEFNKKYLGGDQPEKDNNDGGLAQYVLQKLRDIFQGGTKSSSDATTPASESSTQLKSQKLMCSDFGSSAVCVTVGVGSFHDPVDISGLAHLFEHSVFLGSKKYPQPGELAIKVYENDGVTNATTFSEYTQYFFCCNALVLEECVEMLVDGIVNPLLKEEVIRKEIEAVDSEYAINQTNDSTRLNDFIRSRATSKHPVQKFYWGNKKTLSKPDLLPRMRKWKERYYRGSNMTVCIQAPYPILMIEQMVIQHFSDIPAALPGCPSPTQELLLSGPPFQTKDFNTLYYVVPATHLTSLAITWCLESRFWKEYQTKPLIYVRKLLNSLAPGGVIQNLIKNHWITSVDDFDANCSCSDYFCRTSFGSMFTINVSLTDKGYSQREKVLEALFSYINLLKERGASQELYGDMKMTLANSFHFKNWDELLKSAKDASLALHEAKPEHVLTSQKLMTHFNPKIIEDCLNQLSPHSACFLYVANKRENLEKCKMEAWPCSIKFRRVKMSKEWKAKLANIKMPEFHLPDEGIFLAKPVPFTDAPLGGRLKNGLAFQNDRMMMVAQLDDIGSPFITQKVPSSMITVDFISPITSLKGRINQGMLKLWAKTTRSRVTAQVGHRFDDGLTMFQISTTDDGMQIGATGPSCNLTELIGIITTEAFSSEDQLGEEFYDSMKLGMVKEIVNDLHNVLGLSDDMTSYLLSTDFISKYEMKDMIQGTSYDEFCRLIQTFRRRMQVAAYIEGTAYKRAVHDLVTIFDKLHHKSASILPPIPERVTVLPNGTTILSLQGIHPSYVTSVVMNHYQFRPVSSEEMDKLELICCYMQKRLSYQLRTVEQLSYYVCLSNSSTGLTITVITQPSKFSCGYVDSRIDNFLKMFFTKFVDHENVDPEDNIFSHDLCSKDPKGDFYQLSELYEDHLLPRGASYRKLSVQVTGFRENAPVSHKKKQELSSVEDSGPSSSSSSSSSEQELFRLQYRLPSGAEMSKYYKAPGIQLIKNVSEFKRTLGLYPVAD